MTKIEAINSNIIFKFVEDVTQTRFINSTESGLLITSADNNQTSFPRWGHVISVGPDCVDIKVGDYILIEGGKWTTGFYLEEDRLWKTDIDQVMAVSDTPGKTY